MWGEGGALLSALGMLLCVVAVIALSYWFTRYLAGNRPAGVRLPAGKRLRVLAQTALGKDQRLLVVEAGERCLLLGATPAGITLLAELSEEEAEGWKTGPEAAPRGFQEIFAARLGKKR